MIPERRQAAAPRARDRLHLVAADPRLALDVQREPRREVEPVAEARVDRVLEVRVRVDEARDDRRVLEALARSELGRRADRRDPPVLDAHRAVADRRALDGEHPVGGEDQLSTRSWPSPPRAARSQRRSITVASRPRGSTG